MKWTLNVDCTPAEAREFLGLPDLRPMQSAIIEKLVKVKSVAELVTKLHDEAGVI